MWSIVCLLFFLFLSFVLRYVGSGCTNVVFRLSLSLLGLTLSLYLERILYFAVICLLIRLHPSQQAHSTAWQALLFCKYQIISIFPCCKLQNMNMLSQWYFLIYNNYMRDVIMKRKSLSHDGQQFNQYQQTNPPLTSKSLTTIKTTIHNVGSERAKTSFCWYKWHGWPSLFTLSFHNTYNVSYLKEIATNHQNANTKLKNIA